jgi:hypothetical protein
MLRIIRQTLRTGIATTGYPAMPAQVAPTFRGKPSFDFERWRDARPVRARPRRFPSGKAQAGEP